MNQRSTTRRAVIQGLASSAAITLAGCSASEPPTYGNVLRMGDWLTSNAHRLLLPRQSLARLAYGMNGRELPIAHGAPLRVRVETQLGYKSMKFLRGLVAGCGSRRRSGCAGRSSSCTCGAASA